MSNELYTLLARGPDVCTLDEVKEYLKLDACDEDELLRLLIETVTTFAEKYTGQELRANQWTLTIDCFPRSIELRRHPIDTIDSIVYTDENDAQQTVAATVYYLLKGQQRSQILEDVDQTWPTDVIARLGTVVVTFTTEATSCLEQIKAGMLRHLATLYENRGDCSDEDLSDAAKRSGATMLYDQHRISRV